MAWATFLLWGPFKQVTPRRLVAAATIPILWIAVTLARGAWLTWYPYDFVDVPALGYPTVVVNLLAVVGVWVCLALIIWWQDRYRSTAN